MSGQLSAYSLRLLQKAYRFLRPFFGQRNVCIFMVSCSRYAYYHLKHTFLPLALIKIFVRLLLCNPVTALVRLFFNFCQDKK